MPPPSLSLDRLGTGAACMCAVHCLATPLLVVAFPVAAWLGEGSETALIALSLGISTMAIVRGLAMHRRILPLAFLALAAAVLAARATVAEGVTERGLVVVAALLLVSAHIVNARCMRRTPPRSIRS